MSCIHIVYACISDVDILYLSASTCKCIIMHIFVPPPPEIVVVVAVAWHGSGPWQADKQNDKRRSLIFNAVEIPCKIAKNLHTLRVVFAALSPLLLVSC